MRRLLALILLLSPLALAQTDELGEAPPPPPEPLPPKVTDPEESLEPEVTIRREEDRLVEEYSQNGQVYMVKITPDVGPPYYIMDSDGDGSLDQKMDEAPLEPVKPVHWKVKEWD